jgi:hypothetical protein
MASVLSWNFKVVIQGHNDEIGSGSRYSSVLDGVTPDSDDHVRPGVHVQVCDHVCVYFHVRIHACLFHAHVHVHFLIHFCDHFHVYGHVHFHAFSMI